MINFNQIQDFFVVLMALLGFISVVAGIINVIRNWRKESVATKHNSILQDHEVRLQRLENKTKEQDEFIHVMCNTLLALVSHAINNNSVEKLKEAKEELEKFLINK